MAGIMIAAPSSGSGKTMITCGLLELLKRKGIEPWAFKCGPDYIDGLFHRQVLNVEGGNLDSFFETPEHMGEKLARVSREHFVVAEGVMGYFDGMGGISTEASSFEVAGLLGLPVVLVVDARGASLSLAAQIQGFLTFPAALPQGQSRPKNGIAAIIFNHMSPMMYPRMKKLTEELTGIPVAGCVPELPFLKVASRHLGLVLPGEIENLREQMRQLADSLEKHLDWELLVRIGEGAARPGLLPGAEPGDQGDQLFDAGAPVRSGSLSEAGQAARPDMPFTAGFSPFRLGVAWDETFCFYYSDNLELLKALGAQLVYFSPLHDRQLPEKLDGIILGGGYPENYAAKLSANKSMGQDIVRMAKQGMPMLAECGGYLYLLQELEGSDGRVYPMAGVFPGKGYRKGKNSHFGYIRLEPVRETIYLKEKETIKGHEFHYWDCQCQEASCDMEAVKPVGGRSWPCIRTYKQVMAGFPHLYYPSCPQLARRFGEACRTFAKRSGGVLT